MLKKCIVSESRIGKKKGWSFSIYYDNRPYANFISALFKTKKRAWTEATNYMFNGKFVFYGNAE